MLSDDSRYPSHIRAGCVDLEWLFIDADTKARLPPFLATETEETFHACYSIHNFKLKTLFAVSYVNSDNGNTSSYNNLPAAQIDSTGHLQPLLDCPDVQVINAPILIPDLPPGGGSNFALIPPPPQEALHL